MMTAATLLAAQAAHAQSFGCEEQIKLDEQEMSCYRQGPEVDPLPPPAPKPDPLHLRLLKYAELAVKHRLNGLASYYSHSLDGTLTANGERYHERRFSAAHLTLPLGCWVEVKSRATGRKIRLRVNDRGPYTRKFTIDLSYAAAHALGVDVAEDRSVDIRIIALPGEDPLPSDILEPAPAVVAEEAQGTRAVR